MILSIAILIFWCFIIYNKNKRAQKRLLIWADSVNIELISAERKLIFRGPFPMQGFYVCYLIEVMSDGESEKRWIMLGSVFLGLISNKVEEVKYA